MLYANGVVKIYIIGAYLRYYTTIYNNNNTRRQKLVVDFLRGAIKTWYGSS